jgi:glycerophosphoryl diester phosphodiesterase
MSNSEFFIWAHRGASRRAPENTMAAFRAAEAAGADGIECDIHLSRDGIPVIIHDERVDRTTDGQGFVRKLPLRELQKLDAGSRFSRSFAGEPIPTLEKLLRWAGDRLRLNLEIKTAEAGHAVLENLSSFPHARVLISSFNHRLLEHLRRESPALPLAFLIDTPIWRRIAQKAATCGAESFHPHCEMVSWSMVVDCQRHGMAVFPWTVDDYFRILHLRRWGINGIFTNDPALIAKRIKSPAGKANF